MWRARAAESIRNSKAIGDRHARDEHERTLAFAEIALGQIKALGQPASPRNFEIWYHYATGYKPALNQSINETLAVKGALGDDDLERLYNTYIGVGRAG